MFSYTFPASAAVWGCVAFLLSHQSRATFIEPAVDTNLSQAVKFVFQCSRIQRSLPARRWLRLSLRLNLVLSESLQVFLSQLRDCTPAQQDDITAGSKLLQDLVLKLTGVTTRLAIMENGEGGDGNGRAGWRRAARPAAPTLSAPVQSTASSAASHGNYHFTWLEPCSRDASGCARIL